MVTFNLSGDRGQAFTLEAFAAALVLFGSIVFALQVTSVTPLSSSTSNQHALNQHAATADGMLDAAATNESLRPSLLFWNASGTRFHGTTSEDGYYVDGGPPTAFGRTLNRTFGDDVAFNVYVGYASTSGGVERQTMVRLGSPSDDAVRSTRSVTLYDDDVLYDAHGEPTPVTLAEMAANESFYAPDASPDSPVYNVVHVEVVAWKV